jgi:predicted dehydrogenase
MFHMTRKLRVGVIGTGRMGERHCRVYSSLPEAEFVGIADASMERGRTTAHKYGVRYFADHHDLLREVDAVSIATPTEFHHQLARDALLAARHVLVEKPLAASPSEARDLARLARATGTVCQVGHIERFNPVFLELQIILEDLQIVGLAARRLSPFDTSNTDVDVIYDLMIHDLDLSLTLLGPQVDRVQAHGRSTRVSSADYVVASLSITDGAIANLTASRLTEQKVRLLEITALGAYIEADLLNKSIFIYRRTSPEYIQNHERPLRYRQEGLVERIHIPTAEPLMLELQDFLRCARENAEPKVSVDDGVRALELADEIRDCLQPDVPTIRARTPALLAAAS